MMDEIETKIERIKSEKSFELSTIIQEIRNKKEYIKLLFDKAQQIEKNVDVDIEVPKKFKKPKDIFQNEKDLESFYYNLFFFFFIDYVYGIGYLVTDKDNFFLKIKVEREEYTKFIIFEEELYITEEKAEQILHCDLDEGEMCENVLLLFEEKE